LAPSCLKGDWKKPGEAMSMPCSLGDSPEGPPTPAAAAWHCRLMAGWDL
jgi:hypothetical protein